MIKGDTYKIHNGNSREWRKSPTVEKTPSQWESFKEMKAVYGAAKAQVERDWYLKVGEHLETKANEILIKSDDKAELASTGKMLIKSGELSQKAEALKVKAADITFDGNKASFMGGDLVIK